MISKLLIEEIENLGCIQADARHHSYETIKIPVIFGGEVMITQKENGYTIRVQGQKRKSKFRRSGVPEGRVVETVLEGVTHFIEQ